MTGVLGEKIGKVKILKDQGGKRKRSTGKGMPTMNVCIAGINF